jgi:hypothetical protein
MRTPLLFFALLLLLQVGCGRSVFPSSDVAGASAEEPSFKELGITPKVLNALNITPVTPTQGPRTGFIVGGKNATAVILGLKELNGRTIDDLEKDMRPPPGKLEDLPETELSEFTGGARSRFGFLGRTEKLLEVMAEDNRCVVEQLGLTHQALARPLLVMPALVRLKNHHGQVTYRGRQFHVEVDDFKGYQLSPFRDGTKTNMDVEVKNISNGKSIRYSLLVPQMIERYGFYEGKGLRYRVEPLEVLEVFDFLKPQAQQ